MSELLIPLQAAPALLAAAKLALPAMADQLEALLDIGCEQKRDGQPDRDTLDPDLEPEVQALEAAITATEAALSLAAPPRHLTPEGVSNG